MSPRSVLRHLSTSSPYLSSPTVHALSQSPQHLCHEDLAVPPMAHVARLPRHPFALTVRASKFPLLPFHSCAPSSSSSPPLAPPPLFLPHGRPPISATRPPLTTLNSATTMDHLPLHNPFLPLPVAAVAPLASVSTARAAPTPPLFCPYLSLSLSVVSICVSRSKRQRGPLVSV